MAGGQAIQNPVFRHARCLDCDDFAGVGRLFAHADLGSQAGRVARNLIIEPGGDDRARPENCVPREALVEDHLGPVERGADAAEPRRPPQLRTPPSTWKMVPVE